VLPAHSPYRIALETFERGMLERALAAADGNVSTAAERLGVSRKYLYDRFAAVGIAVRNPRRRRNGHGADPRSDPEPARSDDDG
jgi:DNA-binding NtrC family response regulator